MSKHTEGPWDVHETSIGLEIHPLSDEDGVETIADVNHESTSHITLGQARANAHLIAAAPDLLAACKAALPMILNHRCSYHGPQVCDRCEIVAQVRGAIRKAGEGA